MEREASRYHAAAARESHRTQFNLSVIYLFLAAERRIPSGKSEQPKLAKTVFQLNCCQCSLKFTCSCFPYSYCNMAIFYFCTGFDSPDFLTVGSIAGYFIYLPSSYFLIEDNIMNYFQPQLKECIAVHYVYSILYINIVTFQLNVISKRCSLIICYRLEFFKCWCETFKI